MKKFLLILLSVLSLTVFAQKKTVAVLDPICRDNSVNAFFKHMIRGVMESVVTASYEYEAYDRSALDQIQNEQAFQRSGAVNDSQIRKMGELAGVDYVLVSEVRAYEGYLSAIVKVLNVTTGQYDKSADDYMELKPDAIKIKCEEMASSLFKAPPSSLTINEKVKYQVLTNDSICDFGTIREEDGRVSYVFALNVGVDEISEIKAFCKCVTTDIQSNPYNSGQTLLTATYNPHGRPGGFFKSITIYLLNGGSQEVYLKGKVIPKQ